MKAYCSNFDECIFYYKKSITDSDELEQYCPNCYSLLLWYYDSDTPIFLHSASHEADAEVSVDVSEDSSHH